jgi:hypothetical protein
VGFYIGDAKSEDAGPQDNSSATAPGVEQAAPNRKIEPPQRRK